MNYCELLLCTVSNDYKCSQFIGICLYYIEKLDQLDIEF